jgi:hypothetical protein
VYDESGRIVSAIKYSDLASVDGLLIPNMIRIERPIDGYSLDLQFAGWRVNPDLPGNAFELKPPEGVQVIQLKEKGRSEKP